MMRARCGPLAVDKPDTCDLLPFPIMENRLTAPPRAPFGLDWDGLAAGLVERAEALEAG
ncbi:hypothetical protein [Kitasatospora sp. NPDC085464]|uniref:hypothetical protein n=1 Tax=Kitasatospora sp. NPDC085464 TaxID=3364063 RepID=UPI0037C996A1